MKLTPPTAFWLRCRLPYDVGLLFYWSVCWVEQTTKQSLRRANAMFATTCSGPVPSMAAVKANEFARQLQSVIC